MFTMAFFFEYWRLGWSKMSLLALFTTILQWFMLMWTRQSYIIDVVTAIVFTLIMHRVGEKVSYVFDVNILGVPGHKR